MVFAEVFDIFGFFIFAILLYAGIKVYRFKDQKIKDYGLLISFIAILGLLVDGYIVIKTFLSG